MQTWKTTIVPPQWKASGISIKRFMPDWDYELMDDAANEAFVIKYFPDFFFWFKAFQYPIQRADAIRYMWFYVKGGIYMDLDLELLKPLDPLFMINRDIYVIKSSIMRNVYTNAFIAAKPRLTVMLQCLEDMKAPYAYWHVGKHLQVVNSTGPNMFTDAITKTLANGDKTKVGEISDTAIVTCSICDTPTNKMSDKSAYCRVLGGSSWTGNDTKLLTALYCNRYPLLMILITVVVCVVVLSIWRYKRVMRRRKEE